MLYQRRNVPFAFPQRGQFQRYDLEPVKQILTEGSLFHHPLQVTIGRGHNANIGVERLFPTNPLELLLLQNPQKFNLCLQRHVTDLVEKEGALLSQLKLPLLLP